MDPPEPLPQQPPYPQRASLLVADNDSRSTLGGKSVKLPGNYHIPQVDLSSYLASELDVSRLSNIFPYLWFAGRPGYVRSLHRQRLFRRSIIVTEQADLHLIWHDKEVYVKPLPAFLLCYSFFSRYICNTPFYADACGMLVSYTKLVRHKSDYRVAIELGLLPEDVSWSQWTTFVVQVQPATVSKRYEYGELRLFRLNLIFRFCFGYWICGYHLLHTNFNSFFGSNFAWPLIIFAYLTTVLNAMQVVLASGRQNESVDGLFYGASLAVVIVILGTLCAVAGFFVTLLLYNLVKALRSRERVRCEDIERQAKCA